MNRGATPLPPSLAELEESWLAGLTKSSGTFSDMLKDSLKEVFEVSHTIDGVIHYKPKPEYAEFVKDIFIAPEKPHSETLLEKLKGYNLPFTSNGGYKPEKDEPSPFGKKDTLKPNGWITWLLTRPYYTAGLLEADDVRETLCKYLKSTTIRLCFDEVFFESSILGYPSLRWVLATCAGGAFSSLEQTHDVGVSMIDQRKP